MAQPDELVDFHHLRARRGLTQLEIEDQVATDLQRATGTADADSADANRLNRVLQLTGALRPCKLCCTESIENARHHKTLTLLTSAALACVLQLTGACSRGTHRRGTLTRRTVATASGSACAHAETVLCSTRENCQISQCPTPFPRQSRRLLQTERSPLAVTTSSRLCPVLLLGISRCQIITL